MEFKFTIQDYQTKAAEAVARVFEGQPKIEGFQFVRDLGADRYNAKTATQQWQYEDASGYKNAALALSSAPRSLDRKSVV